MKKAWSHLLVVGLSIVGLSATAFGQGAINTPAKATDWEEINFEFNQAVLTDGFPSLLRLATLLQEHPDYKVTLTGNADQIGSNRANDALSARRADAVSQFLQKYGARANQISTKGDGKKNPEVAARDVNSRFVNRRVMLQVTAPNGTVVGDGSIGSAINEFETYARAQLGKIDAMMADLRSLQTQLQSLRSDITSATGPIKTDTTAIRQDTGAIRQELSAVHADTTNLVGRPIPLTEAQTTQIAQNAANYALTQSALRNKKYSMVGLAFGPTFGGGRTGNYSTSLFAKALIPFGNGKVPEDHGTHALQVDGEWSYYHRRGQRPDGRNDGIFNVGVVNRFNHAQIGTFAQFDYANIGLYRGGAMLGAGVVTIDYVMPGATLGVFAGKGFRPEANVSTSAIGIPFGPRAYLRYQDQLGFQANTAIGKSMELYSNAAWKKTSGFGVPAAATLKLTYWASSNVGLYAQADENPGLQSRVSGYRLLFGVTFGNWLKPSEYGSTTGAVPVVVPQAHYELRPR